MRARSDHHAAVHLAILVASVTVAPAVFGMAVLLVRPLWIDSSVAGRGGGNQSSLQACLPQGSAADFEPLRLPDPLAERDPKGRPFLYRARPPETPPVTRQRPHDELLEVFGIDAPRSVVHPRPARSSEVLF